MDPSRTQPVLLPSPARVSANSGPRPSASAPLPIWCNRPPGDRADLAGRVMPGVLAVPESEPEATMPRKTAMFRQLLQRSETRVAPGAAAPMVARLVERAGFAAVYMTGSGTALARYGFPDVGLVTMTGMVESARAMANAEFMDLAGLPEVQEAERRYGLPDEARTAL